MAEAPKGFMGRWAHRKTESLKGKPLDELVAEPQPDALFPSPDAVASRTAMVPASVAPQELAEEKVLSLDDVKLLTQDSDFKPFMANNVVAEVRNAAMKKLFADPHFNVMDGLDTYIGDYSQPDPVSPAMLRQMAGAKFLNLFENDEKGDTEVETGAEKQNGTAALLPENSQPPGSEVGSQTPENPEKTRIGSPDAAAGQPGTTQAASDAGPGTP